MFHVTFDPSVINRLVVQRPINLSLRDELRYPPFCVKKKGEYCISSCLFYFKHSMTYVLYSQPWKHMRENVFFLNTFEVFCLCSANIDKTKQGLLQGTVCNTQRSYHTQVFETPIRSPLLQPFDRGNYSH